MRMYRLIHAVLLTLLVFGLGIPTGVWFEHLDEGYAVKNETTGEWEHPNTGVEWRNVWITSTVMAVAAAAAQAYVAVTEVNGGA